jgi:hypothetical protein
MCQLTILRSKTHNSYTYIICEQSLCLAYRDLLFIIVIILSGVRLSPLGTVATTGLLYRLQIIDNSDCGEFCGMKIDRGNRSSRRKPAPAPLCPPQPSHEQTRARTQAFAVGSQRLTAWTVTWSCVHEIVRESHSRHEPQIRNYKRRHWLIVGPPLLWNSGNCSDLCNPDGNKWRSHTCLSVYLFVLTIERHDMSIDERVIGCFTLPLFLLLLFWQW